MDSRTLPRWLGWIWVVAGALTVTVALAGAVGAWVMLGSVSETVGETVGVTRRALSTVGETSRVVDGAFDDVAGSLRGVQVTLADASLTLTRASAVTGALGDVIADDVPASIEALRATLPALVDTAGVVDSTMRGLAFFGVEYDAEVPLETSIETIDAQLAAIPALLRAQQGTLDDVAADLASFSSATLEMGDEIGSIRVRLAGASTVLGGYDDLVADSTGLLDDLESSAAASVTFLRVIVTLLGLGVAVTQTAPIVLGLSILRHQETPGGDRTDGEGNA